MNFSETALAVFLGVFLAEMAVSVLRGQITMYSSADKERYADWYPGIETYQDPATYYQQALQAPPPPAAYYDESFYPVETRKFSY